MKQIAFSIATNQNLDQMILTLCFRRYPWLEFRDILLDFSKVFDKIWHNDLLSESF